MAAGPLPHDQLGCPAGDLAERSFADESGGACSKSFTGKIVPVPMFALEAAVQVARAYLAVVVLDIANGGAGGVTDDRPRADPLDYAGKCRWRHGCGGATSK
jgi:hypothetical protein